MNKMHSIKIFNNISKKGLNLLPQDKYQLSDNEEKPEAIILRSFNLHGEAFNPELLAVARAGAGTNNIPTDRLTDLGIPVFNTPGANANAVKELVISSMLLASRNVCQAWDYVQQLDFQGEGLDKEVEKGKKQFAGFEMAGRVLSVIGLGAIGVQIANSAVALGMRVIGFDPGITVQNSWQLSAQVEQAVHIDSALKQADFVTLHVPLSPRTKHLINEKNITLFKPTATLLNFSRAPIVDHQAVLTALNNKKLFKYICDFPEAEFRGNKNIIALPHLGASTREAEENCAVMAANQLRHYLEYGNIKNAVNFPDAYMSKTERPRIVIVNKNIPNMVSQISSVLAEADLNIVDLLNKSRNDIAYTLIDVNQAVDHALLARLMNIEGVIRVRVV